METLLLLSLLFAVAFLAFLGVGKINEKSPFTAQAIVFSAFFLLGLIGTIKGIQAEINGEMVILRGREAYPIQAIGGGAGIMTLSTVFIAVKYRKRRSDPDGTGQPM